MLNDDRMGKYFDGTCHWPLVGAFFCEKGRNERIGRQCERLHEQYISSLEKIPIPLVPGLEFPIDNRRNIARPLGHSAIQASALHLMS